EVCNIIRFRGQVVKPVLQTDFLKGFFLSADRDWTTYRRNYFSLAASFILDAPGIEFYKQGDVTTQKSQQETIISGFMLKMTAEVINGWPVEIIQHTPKRDMGPELVPALYPVIPLAALGHDQKAQSRTVQWDRVQFKSATANNGKRRAQQQYYRVIIELLASTNGDDEMSARSCIARRKSAPLVVRGRSPSHYHNQGPHSGSLGHVDHKHLAPPLYSHRTENGLWSNQQYPTLPPHLNIQMQQSALLQRNELRETTMPIVQYPLNTSQAHPMSPMDQSSKSPQSAQAQNCESQTTIAIPLVNDSENNLNVMDASAYGADATPSESVINDGSSISSHDTQKDFSSTMDTLSTASSIEYPARTLDFVAEFVRMRGIEKLCMDCFLVSTPERCERNFRRVLRSFGTRLGSESNGEVERRAARIFRKHSGAIASRITAICRAKSTATRSLPLASIEPYSEFSMSRYLAEHDATDSEPSSVLLGLTEILPTSEIDSDEEHSVIGTTNDDITQDAQHGGTPLSVYLDFLRSSEAIEDLREELLDFRIAIENTKHREPERPRQYVDPSMQIEAVPVASRSKIVYPFWQRLKDRFQERFRPSLRPGYRRLTWRCDCGKLLHADLDDTDSEAVDALAYSLRNPTTCSNQPVPTVNPRSTNLAPSLPVSGRSSSKQPFPSTDSNGATLDTPDSSMVAVATPAPPDKYLAICISTKRIYKTLIELDVTNLASDASLFAAMKREYQAARGYKAHFASLFKPISVEFVHFSLWNIRHGLVSICDRPECVPPPSAHEYEFKPKPLLPLPPMPPEIFIHYLEHGDGDLLPTRCDWLPRLPKRLDGRMIDKTDGPYYGWGIYIKEGPNRDTIFWLVILTVMGSVVLSICWSALRKDVQGGSGLGTLVLTLPTVVMGAFVFRFTNHD
ncbi:hypothetical protein DE146DRAFT_764375, partial [Phaeosphaeria sp. MPI-PUGE-AT-0046c]